MLGFHGAGLARGGEGEARLGDDEPGAGRPEQAVCASVPYNLLWQMHESSPDNKGSGAQREEDE
jgi:hypothetical protein